MNKAYRLNNQGVNNEVLQSKAAVSSILKAASYAEFKAVYDRAACASIFGSSALFHRGDEPSITNDFEDERGGRWDEEPEPTRHQLIIQRENDKFNYGEF